MRTLSLGIIAILSAISSCQTEVTVLPGATAGSGGKDLVCDLSFGTQGQQPPLPPVSDQLPDGRGVALAMDSLNLGASNSQAWHQLGFNLDDRLSTGDTTGLCQPDPTGPPSAIHSDGVDGVDNNFGKFILPIITGVVPEFEEELEYAIAAGVFTHIFAIESLGENTLYFPLTTRWYHGVSLGSEPAFDGSDRWPLHSDWLQSASDPLSTKTTMPCSYLTGNRWVSSSVDTMNFEFPVGSGSLRLELRDAIATMDLNAEHTQANIGMLGAVIETEALVEQMRQLLSTLSPDLCSTETLEAALLTVRQASDSVLGSQTGPTVACNAVSIGFSFSASEVELGSVALSPGPAPDPCEEDSGRENPGDG